MGNVDVISQKEESAGKLKADIYIRKQATIRVDFRSRSKQGLRCMTLKCADIPVRDRSRPSRKKLLCRAWIGREIDQKEERIRGVDDEENSRQHRTSLGQEHKILRDGMDSGDHG